MKTWIAAAVLTLLAGCAGMNMHGDGSSGDMGMRSGSSGDDMGMRYGTGTGGYNATRDVFHSWVGS
jgi:hypothetical protein